MKIDKISLWGKYKLQQNVEKVQKLRNENKKKHTKKKDSKKKIDVNKLANYNITVFNDSEKKLMLENTIIREYSTVRPSESKFVFIASNAYDVEWYIENRKKFNNMKICYFNDDINGRMSSEECIDIKNINRRDILVILEKKVFNKINLYKNMILVSDEIFKETNYLLNVYRLSEYLNTPSIEYKRFKQKDIWAFSSVTYPGTISSKIINNIYLKDKVILLRNFKTAMKCTDFFSENIILFDGAISSEEIIKLSEHAPILISLYNNMIIYNEKSEKRVCEKIAIEYNGKSHLAYVGNKMNYSYEFSKNVVASCGDKTLTYITNETLEHIKTSSKATNCNALHLKNEYANKYEYTVYNNLVYKSSDIEIMYIYDIEKINDTVRIYTFENGYRRKKSNFTLVDKKSNACIKVDNPAGAEFYSKYSSDFRENFYYYEIEFKNIIEITPINLDTNEKIKFKFMKFMQNECVRNGIGVKRRFGKRIILFDESIKPKTKFELECQEMKKNVYMFVDRGTKADDNAEHLYRYYMNKNSGEEIYYILAKDSKDWLRLQNEGFNLIEYRSEEHKKLYLTAEFVISSHIAKRVINPFKNSIKYEYLRKGKFVFLQHGLMLSEHRGFLDKYSFPIDLFVCSANEEAQMVSNFSKYDNIKTTGLARYDALKGERKGYILYAPSWNTLYQNNFIGSKYHDEVNKVLSSGAINTFLEENDLKIKLVLHPEFMKFNKYFQNSKNVTIIEENELDYNKFISEANGIITDYSSILFDFIYQGKPVIQYKPYNLHHPPTKLKEHKKYVYEPKDLVELEEVLNKIDLKNNTKRSEPNTFFKHVDHKNCERIYNEIKKIQ